MSDETPKEPGPQWKYQDRFPIQDRLVDVLKQSIAAVKAELEVTKRRLRKEKYGS